MMLWQERRWKKRLKMNFFNEERKTKWKFSFRKCSIITRKIWNFLFGSVESKMMKKWNKKNRNSLEGFFLPERKKILNPKSSFGFFLVESPVFENKSEENILVFNQYQYYGYEFVVVVIVIFWMFFRQWFSFIIIWIKLNSAFFHWFQFLIFFSFSSSSWMIMMMTEE